MEQQSNGSEQPSSSNCQFVVLNQMCHMDEDEVEIIENDNEPVMLDSINDPLMMEETQLKNVMTSTSILRKDIGNSTSAHVININKRELCQIYENAKRQKLMDVIEIEQDESGHDKPNAQNEKDATVNEM